MSWAHPIGADTRALLLAAGLDPDALAALVRAAVAEDLDGGIDVTSTATVPAAQRSRADFVARGAGTVAGLPVVAAVIDVVCGPAAERGRASLQPTARECAPATCCSRSRRRPGCCSPPSAPR